MSGGWGVWLRVVGEFEWVDWLDGVAVGRVVAKTKRKGPRSEKRTRLKGGSSRFCKMLKRLWFSASGRSDLKGADERIAFMGAPILEITDLWGLR